MRLSAVMADLNTIQVEIGDEVLNVTYEPNALTPELEDAFMTAVQTTRGGNACAEYLSGLIVKWDLEDEDGKPVPFDIATLRSLPIKFLDSIVSAIMESMNPKKAKNSRSNGSFARRGE